jgi:hypothetical protein
MKGIENLPGLFAGALVLSGTLIWLQPSAGFQPPFAAGQESSPAKRAKTRKPKKWKGKLVDATCVVKALNTVSLHELSGAGQGAPHFANGPSQPGPFPGGGAQQAQPPVVTCPGLGCFSPDAKSGPYSIGGSLGKTTGPGNENPGTGSDVRARMRRAALVDDAVKKCPPSQSTSEFGLALSSGRLIEFDPDGNSKASQAVKLAELGPDKPAKATIEGMVESSGSVHVTSVQIKGERRK